MNELQMSGSDDELDLLEETLRKELARRERELRVAQLHAVGLSNVAIAARLGVSLWTVRETLLRLGLHRNKPEDSGISNRRHARGKPR